MRNVKQIGLVIAYWFLWPATGGAIIAVGQADNVPSWVTGSTTITGTLVLGWFAWYTITKTLPEMQRAFRDELVKERELFKQMMDDKDGRHERETGELRRMLSESLSSDRRAVHDVANVSQVMMQRDDLRKARDDTEKKEAGG